MNSSIWTSIISKTFPCAATLSVFKEPYISAQTVVAGTTVQDHDCSRDHDSSSITGAAGWWRGPAPANVPGCTDCPISPTWQKKNQIWVAPKHSCVAHTPASPSREEKQPSTSVVGVCTPVWRLEFSPALKATWCCGALAALCFFLSLWCSLCPQLPFIWEAEVLQRYKSLSICSVTRSFSQAALVFNPVRKMGPQRGISCPVPA